MCETSAWATNVPSTLTRGVETSFRAAILDIEDSFVSNSPSLKHIYIYMYIYIYVYVVKTTAHALLCMQSTCFALEEIRQHLLERLTGLQEKEPQWTGPLQQ